ncbi:MAG: uroporphyrinogen-III C-methyltransferase [Methanobrevibacter sp.]|jgi:uroporphyrin-III C-methyltransferase|nr:uroporphyrinogen-III C-methyltransferase [Candidatus Methanovirga aequatorialis]
MTVYLVGAGPGDPELITLKGVNVLKRANVIIYDNLANEEILKHGANAKKIYVGKKARKHYKKQEEINEILIKEGKNNENVVRLKGGDPFVFGRGGEEILALIENNISFEVVPGITSAVGIPTSLGLPVSHRAVATSFTIITGHEDPKKKHKQVKWDYRADTLIILMGVGNIKENTKKIMEYRSEDTPVCVIENGTLPNEKIIFGTLSDIGGKKIDTPAILVVGEVVDVYKKIKESRIKSSLMLLL